LRTERAALEDLSPLRGFRRRNIYESGYKEWVEHPIFENSF